MNYSLKKYSVFYIYSIAFLFLILYFILSFHSRLAGDDYFYLWLSNKFGAWNGMLFQYREWSGRWTAHFLGCLMITQWKNSFFLPFINFITFLLLYLSIKISLNKILSNLKIRTDRYIIPAFSIILIATFFFSSYSIGETWFWYIIILTYLWSITGFIFLINCIFSNNKSMIINFLIAFLSIYIGGASESYASIFIVLLVSLVFYRRIISKEGFYSTANRRIFFALIVLIISFSISAFAPGTEIRHSLLPQTSLTDKFIIASKAYLKIFIRFLPGHIVYLVLFSSSWIIFGSHFIKIDYEKKQIKNILRRVTFIFLVCLAIMVLPTAIVMSETGPDRALSVISLITTIYFAIIFSLIGIYFRFNNTLYKIIMTGVCGITISILTYHIYSQYNICKIFTESYKERFLMIENAKENNFKGVLELLKLPPHGMLYWDELSEDTTFFTNKHLKDGLDLPFQVKLRVE